MNTLYINGKWIQPVAGLPLAVIDPTDAKPYSAIGRGDAADTDLAVRAARQALSSAWGEWTAAERGRLLLKAAALLAARVDDFAAIEARDTGKPLVHARAEINVLVRYFEFYGGAADKLHGQVIPFIQAHQALVTREALGVTAHIIPWNSPAVMFGRTLPPHWRSATPRCSSPLKTLANRCWR